MTRFPTGEVPSDMWICGKCKGGNLIALTSERCPVCEHTRDNCCIGPGEPYTDTAALFPGISTSSTATSFHWFPGPHAHQFKAVEPYMNQYYTFEHGTQTYGSYKKHSVYEHDMAPPIAKYAATPDFTTLGGAGSPAPGTWTCEHCGATNSSLTSDFCPDCGRTR